MSGLYNPNFSPARAVSPQIRSTPDVESNQYWSELLAEHQKIAPFMQVLPICNRLLNQDSRIMSLQSIIPYMSSTLKEVTTQSPCEVGCTKGDDAGLSNAHMIMAEIPNASEAVV